LSNRVKVTSIIISTSGWPPHQQYQQHGTIWGYGDDACWGQKKYWGVELKGDAAGKSMSPFMEYIVRDAYKYSPELH
jgi:hypothetical protein